MMDVRPAIQSRTLPRSLLEDMRHGSRIRAPPDRPGASFTRLRHRPPAILARMSLTAGTHLGAYEILGPLGSGGMGEVYRARDLRLGREVAVKVLPAEVAATPDRLARFEREARTVASLNHPNIVTLFSVEDADGVRFLTMELVEGRTLSDVMTPGGLPQQRILELAIALTDALVAAHERGVIHRDLKPANVMVTRDGRLKVLDFGLAKLVTGDADAATRAATVEAAISGEGKMFGTVPYMAPEQLRGEDADARSDVFALGIVLYELAVGKRPFAGETLADVSSAILRDTPAPLTRVRADLPGDLEQLLSQCLEKNPRERMQTALDVGNALRRLRQALEPGAGTPRQSPGAVASIAVLPFANRSGSVDDEYFSDGLADELLSVLAKIQGLRVTARTSSFHFKGKDVTIAEVGQALNVATILEGSVRKAGNRVRISVQLVKAPEGYQLWSETYDRTLEDIFAVQDDIAQSVVKELRSKLLGETLDSDASGEARADVANASRGRSANPEAQRLYLLGRHLADRFNPDDSTRAITYLEEALALDPKFALAWAELSRILRNCANTGWIPQADGFVRSRAAATHAIASEPDLADGHVRLSELQTELDWDFRGAAESMARALELAPGSAIVLGAAAVLANRRGERERALALHRRSLELDPLISTRSHNYGLALAAADRPVEAEAALRKALELAPKRSYSRAYLALAMLAQGRPQEALVEALREPLEDFRLFALVIIHHSAGRRDESDAALRDLIRSYAEKSAKQIAEAHAFRGEVDEAFTWLEHAYAQRDAGLSEIKPNRFFRPYHGDPRWAAFLLKMGLAD